jgi:glyoxylase-like metal-dependent hydrolase (beta-lactamase superfamily II)
VIHVIDLEYGVPRTTAAFLVETNEGPALVETGPESTYPVLARELAKLGHAPEDVRHVFLTHIHLDHAGAAWRFAEQGARIHVHPRGARHLRDPSRLLASARRIFGVHTEKLWGAPQPVAAESIEVARDGATVYVGGVRFEALETPGHAYHHHAWRVEGSVFTGDVGGVRIGDGPVFSPTPPPEIEVGLWRESIARLRASRAEELYLSHFGRFTDVSEHLDELEACLIGWSEWMRSRVREAPYETIAREFQSCVAARLEREGLGPAEQEEYEFADPAWMNVQGLFRYWCQERDGDSG